MSFGAVFALFIMISLVVACTGLWLFIKGQSPPTIEYTSDMPTWNFSFRAVSPELDNFNRKDRRFSEQSREWQKSMNSIGRTLRSSKVRQVFFMHGTFVGDDPVGFIAMVKAVYPTIPKVMAARVSRLLKRHTNKLAGDLGNFTEEYIQLFAEAVGGEIPCASINWSSGNHHFARLEGAVLLLSRLADVIRRRKLSLEDRILIIGHSHAGQIFALLAQLIEFENYGYRLTPILAEAEYDLKKIRDDLLQLHLISLDFVTMGAPVIYTWPDSGYYRLMNIVNHRGSSHLAGSLRGILHTKDGDYIQQLGILGTDLIASTPLARRLNRKLDEVFGKGRDIKAWRARIAKKMRVSPHGKTFLVNYKDHSRTLPNFFSTLMGHGVYTKYEKMLFNSRLIAEYFYKYHPR